jgi:hypothetical protein
MIWPQSIDLVFDVTGRATGEIDALVGTFNTEQVLRQVAQGQTLVNWTLDSIMTRQASVMAYIVAARRPEVKNEDRDTVEAFRNYALALFNKDIYGPVAARALEITIDNLRRQAVSWVRLNPLAASEEAVRRQGKRDIGDSFSSLLRIATHASAKQLWTFEIARQILRTLNNHTNNLAEVVSKSAGRNSQARAALKDIIEGSYYSKILLQVAAFLQDTGYWPIMRPDLTPLRRAVENLLHKLFPKDVSVMGLDDEEHDILDEVNRALKDYVRMGRQMQ